MIKLAKKGFTLIELMIVVAIIGLLAALAIPNFIKFQAKSRQSEARANLKSVYTSEKSYYGDQQTYYDEFDVIGFAPEGNNRYAYFAGGGGLETRKQGVAPTDAPGASAFCATGPQGIGEIDASQNFTANVASGYAAGAINGGVKNTGGAAPSGVVGVFQTVGPCCGGGVCDFCSVAIGNVDNDTTLDQWFICSVNGGGGASVACGGGGVTPEWQEGSPVNDCDDVQY